KLSFLWLCGLFFLIEFRYVGATMRSVRALAFLGLVLNVALISFLIIALFSRRLTNALIRLSVRLLGKMHFVKNVPEMMDRAQEKLEQYHECAQFFRRNPRQIMKTFGVLTVQRLAILIIPFCIYKSFGMTGQTLFHVVATQLIVNLCCDMMPIPGAVGISEAIFLTLFGPIFSERNLYPAVLMSRGISFYFLLVASGVAIILFKVVKAIRRRH
ncbi:MAG: flippase-like domain-containing protein, partial [Lachnospiraceae bacterium]|nr:flippase-like domain-containing protein [Lachnospiraceae bacterium]